MSWRAVTYLGFTLALGIVFAGLIAYYFSGRRRGRVESPKYRMLRDDLETPENGTRR